MESATLEAHAALAVEQVLERAAREHEAHGRPGTTAVSSRVGAPTRHRLAIVQLRSANISMIQAWADGLSRSQCCTWVKSEHSPLGYFCDGE